MKTSRSHHLAKHSLASEVDVELHFGSSDPKEIAREISRLGQKQLQAKFNQLFTAKTFSNNNQWLRRKLLEAAGIQAPKAQGKSRSAQTRRSTSPVNASAASSSALSCDAGIRAKQEPACTTVKNARPLSTVSCAGKDEVRRTKRQRRPRTYDDMLLLDSPTGCDDRLQDEAFLQQLDTPVSPGVCKQKLAGLPLQHLCSPQHSNKWQMSRSSAASHFSDLSSQSSAKYPKLFSEPALPGHAAMVSPYHIKAQRLRLPADSYDEQLIRAGSVGSTSELLHHGVGMSPYRQATSSMPALHARRSFSGSRGPPMNARAASLHAPGLGDPYDLGGALGPVPSLRPHLAPSRPANSLQLNGPLSEPCFMQSKQLAASASGRSSRLAPAVGGDAEAFANSLLDVEVLGAEARCMPASPWHSDTLPRPASVPLCHIPDPGFDIVKEAASDSLLVDTAVAPSSASSLNSVAAFSCPPQGIAAPAAAVAPPQHPSSPLSATSTTPMDLIMLQELVMGSMPMDPASLQCTSSAAETLLAEPTPMALFMEDPLLSLGA